MHLYFLTRGINHKVSIWKKFMETQMFNWKRKNIDTGKEEICLVQGALRPVQLWEYVFPEESLDEVLTALQGDPGNPKNSFTKTIGAEKSIKNKTKLAALRKMLGAQKIPEYKQKVTGRYIETRGVSIHPIGIKKDKRGKFLSNFEGNYEQEML